LSGGGGSFIFPSNRPASQPASSVVGDGFSSPFDRRRLSLGLLMAPSQSGGGADGSSSSHKSASQPTQSSGQWPSFLLGPMTHTNTDRPLMMLTFVLEMLGRLDL
jgi:hypothetical protein